MKFDWSILMQGKTILHGKYKFTVQLFYETLTITTKWFSALEDSVIHALGTLLNFWKAYKTLACGS